MRLRHVVAGVCLALTVSLSAQAASSPETIVRQHLEAAAPGIISASDAATVSEILKEALTSDHRGLEGAALRLVIAYGDQLEVDRETVFEIVKLYRDNSDEQLRQMAIVALGAVDDSWGRDFLERSKRFENSDKLKHTIRAVLSA